MLEVAPNLKFERERPRHRDIVKYGELQFLNWMAGALPKAPGMVNALVVQTPVNLGFVRVLWNDGKPIGYYTYAYLNEDAVRRIGLDGRGRVEAKDYANEKLWYSGNNLWVIDFVTPYRSVVKQLWEDFSQNVPANTHVFYSARPRSSSSSSPRLRIHERQRSGKWRTTNIEARDLLALHKQPRLS